MQDPVLNCLHEFKPAGQTKSWVLPCGHIACTSCVRNAEFLHSTSTRHVCPVEGCYDLFRFCQARLWGDEAEVLVEGSNEVVAGSGQECVVPVESVQGGHAGASARGGRGGSSQASRDTSPSIASNHVQREETVPSPSQAPTTPTTSTRAFPTQSPVPGTFSNQTPRTAPAQPSPLRKSFPLAVPSSPPAQSSPPSSQLDLPSSQVDFPSSQPGLASSQPSHPTNSPFSSRLNSSQTSTTSIGSTTSVETTTSDGTTASDRELTESMNARLQREIPFENLGGEGVGNEERGDNEEGQGGNGEVDDDHEGHAHPDDHEGQAGDGSGGQGDADGEQDNRGGHADITEEYASESVGLVPATPVHAPTNRSAPTTSHRAETPETPVNGRGKRRRANAVDGGRESKKRTVSGRYVSFEPTWEASSSQEEPFLSSSQANDEAHDNTFGFEAQAVGSSRRERGDSEDEESMHASSPERGKYYHY